VFFDFTDFSQIGRGSGARCRHREHGLPTNRSRSRLKVQFVIVPFPSCPMRDTPPSELGISLRKTTAINLVE